MLPDQTRIISRNFLLVGCLLAACGGGSSNGQTTPSDTTMLPGAGTTGASNAGRSAGATTAGAAATAGHNAPGGTGTVGIGTAGTPGQVATNPSSGTAGTPGGVTAAAGGGAVGPTTPSTGAGAGVLEFHGNPKRDGNYVDAAFTRAAAKGLKLDAGFKATMTGPTYAQPLYFPGGPGGKDIVIVATETNEVSAFDAMTGAMVWRSMVAPAGPQGGGPGGCGLANISPSLGVTGTPVIDAASRTLFLDAMTTGGKHNIFALSLDDGKTKPGWPVDVTTLKAGSLAFNSPAENQRGALTILKGVVYVPYGGHYGDCGDYHGWVVGVPIDDPKAPLAWATRGSAGGIWAPSGVASDGASLFVATGNTMSGPAGAFPAFSSPGMWSDGEAIIRLPGDLMFNPMMTKDFYTPQNWASLDQGDSDVGGSGVVLVDAPGSMPSALAVAFGKDGNAFVASRENLGGMGGQVGQPTPIAPGTQIMQSSASYSTATGTFVAVRARASGCTSPGVITAMKVAGSPPALTVGWCGGSTSTTGSPIATTTDGKSESIVWYAGGGKLVGLDGEMGTEIVSVSGIDNQSQWQTPIVANGRIYVAANSSLHAFSLNSQ